MIKKAFKIGRLEALPIVDTLEELYNNEQLLETDFSGIYKVRIKSIPPTKFIYSDLFYYGVARLDNYKTSTRTQSYATTSIEAIKMPVIKNRVALDLAVKYQQQHEYFSDYRPEEHWVNGKWSILELDDTTYAYIVTSALLSANGFEVLANELASSFEPKARNNIFIRLMYANFVMRIIKATECMATWIDVAGRSNAYGYTPEEWKKRYRWSKEILTRRENERPHRNIIGEELKDYLLHLELEASKAISYIIAYNNLPADIISKDEVWQHEGIEFFSHLSELKEYNLTQIDKIKENLKRAREFLNKHFEILLPPVLGYPDTIHAKSTVEKTLPRSVYVFFSNSLANITPNFSINDFFDTTFDNYIYKPPYAAPKSSLDLDIASMETKIIKNNATFNTNINELSIDSEPNELLDLHNSCNAATTSAVNCLGFVHMRYRAYMESNYSEYVRIFNDYMAQLIIPAIHNLLAIIKMISDANFLDTKVPSKENLIAELNAKLSKIESMLPQNEVNVQKQDGEYRVVETRDLLEGIRNEVQLILGSSNSMDTQYQARNFLQIQ